MARRRKIYSLCLHLNRVVTLQVRVPDGVDAWLERFLVAADIKDDIRKRALLLYQAGFEVYEIFKTLEEDKGF